MSKRRNEERDYEKEIEIEKRRISELFREIKGDSHRDDKLTWMYKNPSQVVESEEYLLGRSVDKALDEMAGRQQPSTSDLANYRKRVINAEGAHITEQIDVRKKVQEDPLFAIRQKEMDARKQWLNNPLKMKEIKKIVAMEAKKKKKAEHLERKAERRRKREERVNLILMKTLRKLEGRLDIKALLESSDSDSDPPRKKSKNRKESSTSGGSSSSDEDSSDDETPPKRKRRRSISSESDMKTSRSKNKIDREKENKMSKKSDNDKKPRSSKGRNSSQKSSSKHKTKKNDSSTDKESTREEKYESGKGKKNRKGKENSNSKPSSRESSTDDNRDSRRKKIKHDERRSEDSTSLRKQKKGSQSNGGKRRDSLSNSDVEPRSSKKVQKKTERLIYGTPSDDGDGWTIDQREKKQKKKKKEKNKKYDSSDDEGWDIDTRKDDADEHKGRKQFGLSTLDGSKPDKSERYVAPYQKKEEAKASTIVKKPMRISEKEREYQLKEMMENAKWRKTEREIDFKKHKKIKEREEKIADYDESFLSNEMSKLTGHGSMADRIKSNRNNIQRSGGAMEKNFVRK